MAANLQQLKDEWLFEARLRYPDLTGEQKDWLVDLYLDRTRAREDGEITATAFESESHSMAFRGSTPEDRRLSLKLAIEHLEAVLADAVAADNAPRPFAVRFTEPPHYALG